MENFNCFANSAKTDPQSKYYCSAVDFIDRNSAEDPILYGEVPFEDVYSSALHELKYLNREDFQKPEPEFNAKPLTVMCKDKNTQNECWVTGDKLDLEYVKNQDIGHFMGVCKRECNMDYNKIWLANPDTAEYNFSAIYDPMWEKIYGAPFQETSELNADGGIIDEPGNSINSGNLGNSSPTETPIKPTTPTVEKKAQRVYVNEVIPGVKYMDPASNEFGGMDAQSWGIIAIIMMVVVFILLILVGISIFNWRKTKGKLASLRDRTGQK